MNRVERHANRLICTENSVLEPLGSVVSKPVLATPVVVGAIVVGAGVITGAVAVNGDNGSFAATAFTGASDATPSALSAGKLIGARRALA